jgi:serine/threonine protein kinase
LLQLCPTCRRRFVDAGFCPFDGTALVADADAEQPTLVSGPLPRLEAPDAPPRRAKPSSDAIPTIADRLVAGAASPVAPVITPQDLATQIEVHKRTVPLPPALIAGTGEVTSARTRPASGPVRQPAVRAPSDTGKIESRSASENPSAALELYHAPRPNEYDKLVGQTLDGRYYVEKKIGEGGMGVVFSVRHAVIERPLAIKVLKREAMRDTATIRRFVQEAKAASRIGHPNIVDVTDFGTTPDGMTYSVMEFVPGLTLGTALRLGSPFPALRAIRIAAQIARALGAAHDKGIVHRDLKPENVFLLDRDGREDFVKIVDFGIAKVTPPPGQAAEPRLTRAGSVFGTPEYMAPEQAAGRSDTDGRVDIYALGVILYEMICGQVPHRGDSMVRTLAMQMLDPIVPPSKVRPDLVIGHDLEAVVMHALAKKRDERFATMADLLVALDAVLPPMVAKSLTGSPVYTLAALPPGADPGVVPALPAMPLQSSEAGRPWPQDPAAHPSFETKTDATTRRVKDEPQFTADDRPVSFQHVFTEELVPARQNRWPVLLLLAMIAGGGAGAIGLMIKSRNTVIAEASRDAGALAPPDAASVLLPGDAEAALDAGDVIVVPEPDAGQLLRPPRTEPRLDAGRVLPETPNHRGTIGVQVLTKPEGANLYDDGGHYRGPGGAQLEEPLGKKLTVHCKQPGYKPGTVEISFDGSATAVLCVLQRIKVCIKDIKNPFDDCVDPASPGAQ